MTWLDAQTMLPTMATRKFASGKPTRLPRMTFEGFFAYRWKSAAFEAKVAQFAAPSMMKRITSHAFSLP